MIFKVTNSEGALVRSGICQEIDLEAQAGAGETVSISTDEEIAQLKQSVAVAGNVAQLPGAEAPAPSAPPLENWTVLIRALKREGITLDLDAARAELSGEIATKRAQSAAVRR